MKNKKRSNKKKSNWHQRTSGATVTQVNNPDSGLTQQNETNNACRYTVPEPPIRNRPWYAKAKHLTAVIGLVLGLLNLYALYSQIKQANHTLKLDQRAWMGLDIINAERPTGQPFKVVLKFPNSGKTPALNVHSFTEVQYLRAGQTATFHDDESKAAGHAITVPGSNYFVTSIKSISTDEATLLVGGDLQAWVSGTIWYEDIFMNKHWTQFCQKAVSPLRSWDTCPHEGTDKQP